MQTRRRPDLRIFGRLRRHGRRCQGSVHFAMSSQPWRQGWRCSCHPHPQLARVEVDERPAQAERLALAQALFVPN
jgi:hypothetical protein